MGTFRKQVYGITSPESCREEIEDMLSSFLWRSALDSTVPWSKRSSVYCTAIWAIRDIPRRLQVTSNCGIEQLCSLLPLYDSKLNQAATLDKVEEMIVMKETPTWKKFDSMSTSIMWQQTNEGRHKLSLMTRWFQVTESYGWNQCALSMKHFWKENESLKSL